jgi:hypothetical protein
MTRTDFAQTRTTTRLAGALFAATMTLAVVSVLSEQLHVERFGEGSPVVELDRVIVTPKRPAGDPAFAAAPTTSRSN